MIKLKKFLQNFQFMLKRNPSSKSGRFQGWIQGGGRYRAIKLKYLFPEFSNIFSLSYNGRHGLFCYTSTRYIICFVL